jgi:hypothetical protein
LEYDFELARLLWDLGSRARYFFDKLTEAFKQAAMELSDYSLVEISLINKHRLNSIVS